MGLSGLKPEMRSINYWIQTHAPPIWITTADIAIIGFCLILITHAWQTKSPKSILAIGVLAFTTFTPSFISLMYSNTPKLGMILEIFLVACVLYIAIVAILVMTGEGKFLREAKDIPLHEGASWPDEFEHLKVKEELEYELSQKFPGYWDASSSYSKRERLKYLEQTGHEFDKKYGHQKMALIIAELKERLEELGRA